MTALARPVLVSLMLSGQRLRRYSFSFVALLALLAIDASQWPAEAVQRASHSRIAAEASRVMKPALSDLRQALTKKFEFSRPRPIMPQAPLDSVLAESVDGRTAVYDISARAVFLPDGTKLEAHSGLGKFRDDPRSANEKNRGVTPPNVYDLTLREQPFHGVKALRLTPAPDGAMYGRNGILAHTYMLGASGASNGCVVFRDYDAFLQAYMSGSVTRLVVVSSMTALAPKETQVADR